MELLLLTDVPGIGRKDDLVVVRDGFALNSLLPYRKALVATPNVRRRYAEQIKRRAEEREKEIKMKKSVLAAVEGKKVSFTRKATKTGKLYAAITEEIIAEELKKQHGIAVAADDIAIDGHIKSLGEHTITVNAKGDKVSMTVEIMKEE